MQVSDFCKKLHQYKQKRRLVSKETVVLHQWESETKFWIYQLS